MFRSWGTRVYTEDTKLFDVRRSRRCLDRTKQRFVLRWVLLFVGVFVMLGCNFVDRVLLYTEETKPLDVRRSRRCLDRTKQRFVLRWVLVIVGVFVVLGCNFVDWVLLYTEGTKPLDVRRSRRCLDRTKQRFVLRWGLLIVGVFVMLGCNFVDRVLRSGSLGDYDRSSTLFLSGSQPRTLDPATTLGGPDGPLGHIFSGLTTLDTNLQVQPELAAGWTVSDDGLVYTFYLRKDAVFHNGRSVTANDIIYSWERAADPATGSDTAQTYLGDIEGVVEKLNGRSTQISGLRAVDDHTLEVRLTAPVVYFLSKLAYPVAYVVDQDNVSQSGWEYQPNGTGPFKLATWQDDALLVLERNDFYYGELPQLQHVVYDLGPNLPLSQYETGEIDLIGIGGTTLERARDPNSPFYDQLQTGVGMCTSTIGLNAQLPPFDDVRVRQAFNYALDKELLIDTFSNGNGLVATGSLPPGMPGFTGSNGGYPYDPERARQLLAEAGYANPADLPVLTYSTSGYGDVGGYVTAVITLWQQNLGVTIEPIVIEPYTFYDELYAGNVGHIYGSGWCADYPDPQNFLDILYHSQSRQNVGGYVNSEVDTLLEQARTERDVETRLMLYAEIEKKIVADAPVVFVSHGETAVLVSPDLQNYVLTPIGVPQWHRVRISR